MANDGNLYGTCWNGTGLGGTGSGPGWARDAVQRAYNLAAAAVVDSEVYSKATSDGRYVQNVQLGAHAASGALGKETQWNAPAGCVITGTYVGDSGGSQWWYRRVQKNVNGTWYNVAGL